MSSASDPFGANPKIASQDFGGRQLECQTWALEGILGENPASTPRRLGMIRPAERTEMCRPDRYISGADDDALHLRRARPVEVRRVGERDREAFGKELLTQRRLRGASGPKAASNHGFLNRVS